MSNLPKYYKDNTIIFSTAKVYNNIELFKNERFCKIFVDTLKFYKNKFKFKLYGYVIMPNHVHLLLYLPWLVNELITDDGRAVINPGRVTDNGRAIIHPKRAIINSTGEDTAAGGAISYPFGVKNKSNRVPTGSAGKLLRVPTGSAGKLLRVPTGSAGRWIVYYPEILRNIKSYSARRIVDILKKENPVLLNKFKFQGPKNHQYKIWRKSNYDFNIFSDKKFDEKLTYIHNNPIKAGLVSDLKDYPWSSYQNYYLNNHSLIEIDYQED